jgi:hypothetical protein
VAILLALVLWLRDETPDARAREMVRVWPGKVEQVEAVAWESKKKKVRLDARSDAVGRWYVGSVEQEVARVKAKPKAPVSSSGQSTAETETQRRRETTRFVSAGEAEDFVELLAPLEAFRAIGAVDQARAKEFGLDEPQGTLRVTIAGVEHTLIIGGSTPGGGDFYARHGEGGEVYAIPGEIARSVMQASSRLLERKFHAWGPEDITRVVISTKEVERELVPVSGKKNAWANPDTPEHQDETAGNWMTKLERLRVQDHVEKPQGAERIARVDYYEGSTRRGHLELYRAPGNEDHPDYLVRTEYTRWYARVFHTSAAQLEQDLGSVVR